MSKVRFGFRYDPLEDVENDSTWQGALVRTRVLREPRPSDAKLIQERISEMKVVKEPPLTGRAGRGRSSVPSIDTDSLEALVDLGAGEDHPEIRRALELLDRIPAPPKRPVGLIRTLCRLGRADHPVVRASIRMEIDSADDWLDPLSGCPWTPSGGLRGLWTARDVDDTIPVVERGLAGIRDGLEENGCLAFNDPWGFVACAANIDLPVCRGILEKQVPLILRAQQPDGGWGDDSHDVFQALTTYGLLHELRQRPPLPPDWKVTHAIPVPALLPLHLTWDGRYFWTWDEESEEVIAFSYEDGKPVHRLELPAGTCRGLGWWDGRLAVTQGLPDSNEPKRLLSVDPEDGQVVAEVPLDDLEHVGGAIQLGMEIWIFDAFFGCAYVTSAATPGRRCRREVHLPTPIPMSAQPAADGTFWCVEAAWSPYVVRTDRDGRLHDWAERPFSGHEGVAWDGRRLWGLDPYCRQLCVVEPAGSRRPG